MSERASEETPASYEAERSGVRFRVHRQDQVVHLATDDPFGAELAPRARDVVSGSRFTSAALLAIKAKQVDDGIYAAVELAAQRGAGTFKGKYALLHEVLARVSGGGTARATIDAASSLGGQHACAPGLAEEIKAAFLADELRSKPVGFYTWSDELSRLFRQDRLLQTDLSRAPDVATMASAIGAEPALRAAYEACLRLPEKLTNALAAGDLRDVMSALEGARPPDTGRPIAFLPASIAHETTLVKRLFGAREIPSDFDLSKELVRQIRSGQIDLTPAETSGWYDVQTWALETLAAPERGVEASRLELASSYVEHLDELFRGILTATRETHVKQLEVPLAGCAAPTETRLTITPHLTVEPLVTHYQRRADTYRFVRAVLVEIFGEEALDTLHGLRREGPVAVPLGIELAAIVHLFDGAAATAMRELGMPTRWDHTKLTDWRAGEGDADTDADLRAMVPVFHDVARRKTKVWMILGWTRRSLQASFATPPRVEVLGSARAKIEFGSAWHPLASPVMEEAYVSRILDRDEFRRHCDQYRTRDEIVAALL